MLHTERLYWNIPDSYYDESWSGYNDDDEEDDDTDYEFLHADARIEDREG